MGSDPTYMDFCVKLSCLYLFCGLLSGSKNVSYDNRAGCKWWDRLGKYQIKFSEDNLVFHIQHFLYFLIKLWITCSKQRLLWNRHQDTLTHVMGRPGTPVYVQREVDGCYSNLTFQKSRDISEICTSQIVARQVLARTCLELNPSTLVFYESRLWRMRRYKNAFRGAEKCGPWTDSRSHQIFTSLLLSFSPGLSGTVG